MSIQTWQETIASMTSAGPVKNTWTTAATGLNPQALVSLPPNYLYPGKQLRITVLGALSNVVTAQPTFAFQVMIGAVIAWTSGNVLTNQTAHTLLPFKLVIDLRCDTVGSGTSAKFLGIGMLTGVQFLASGTGADPVATHASLMLPVTAPAVGTGFDASIANVLDFFVACSASNAGNGITIHEYYVEALN